MHLQIYIKTTETCNLNCDHCYTSGKNGKRVFFNASKTLAFLHRLKRARPDVDSVKILFHGGEPMLAPIADLWDIYHNANIWKDTDFSITTNLAYPMTEEKAHFFETVTSNGMGSSYDLMRFRENPKAQEMFERNSKILNRKIPMTLMISLDRELIATHTPKQILDYALSLDYKYILFERITGDGNASLNPHIFPKNEDQDKWLHDLFRVTIEDKYYEKIGNMFLSELASSFVEGMHGGNRCRNCEQTLITVNADGTISGCPNTAPRDYWGHIDMDVGKMLGSEKREEVIACEIERDERCYTCDAFSVCNGDCHQLEWQGDYCAAPKMIWKEMLRENDIETYRKLILV
jgi:radical SAM protein with 4Fe4S-binding SPASM domain